MDDKSSNFAFLSAEDMAKRIEKEPFKKLSQIVGHMLEDAILTRKIAPGTKINVMQIAQALGISRTPVKDAIELLVQSGMVVTPNKGGGYYVFDISGSFMDQLFEARRMIEGEAAFLCAQRNNRIDMETFETLAENFSTAYEKGDFKKFTKFDQDFHNLIVYSCGNQLIINMYRFLHKNLIYYWARTRDYLHESKGQPFRDFEVIANQHRSIYRSIYLGVPDVAEGAMRAHLTSVHTAFYALSPPTAFK